MAHFVIGTSGHVDHGKTTLIKALTGIDADRLIAEKERGMTLDLGFAHIDLPSGTSCGIVDVPGHEKYIKNMLPGIGGLDYALLVVDAGEGIMPQTREHFEILQLMNVQGGLCVLTKADKVSPDQIKLRQNELRKLFTGTFLEKSEIIPVSSITGEGLSTLISKIDEGISKLTPRDEDALFRLPVDRVFTLPGFGVIVTGTVYQGQISVENNVIILPADKKAKIRKMQVHGKDVKIAFAGQRLALNLSRIDMEQLRRGDQVLSPGLLSVTNHLDVVIEVLKSSPHPLKNQEKVRLYITTQEIFSKVVLLDSHRLEPGEKGFARLVLDTPAAALSGDRFVIRAPSAIYTIGGGKILDTHPPMHRRFDKSTIEILRLMNGGDAMGILTKVMTREPYVIYNQDSLAAAVSLPLFRVSRLIEVMKEREECYFFPSGRFVLKNTFNMLCNKVLDVLDTLQNLEPGAPGRKQDEVRRNMPKMEERLFREIIITLKNENKIKEKNGRIAKADFIPTLGPEQKKCYEWMKDRFIEGGFTPPTRQELIAQKKFKKGVITDVIDFMLFCDEIVALDDSILFITEKLNEAKKKIGAALLEHGFLTAAQARDLLGTTRKYIIPLLEYFDKIYFTRREGDIRKLFRKNVIAQEIS